MRKIKLMALLLATLMIVSAFAGCAGVKKEELDALDVRVQALEDLLNGQQKDLEDIKNQIADIDNSEVLDAIESIKTDLEDKIKDVNDRVDDEVGKADASVTVSDAVKTEQQKALAKIEVQRAAYAQNSYKYSTENYEKISEALGTATGAVNAATTVEGVAKALAAMDAELAKYLTYQDMAYKYYVDLLGNVNVDAEDLVNEAKAFLKEVKAVYDEDKKVTGTIDNGDLAGNNLLEDAAIEGYRAELLYLVKEGTSDARDQYIDMYNAVYSLCELYSGAVGTTKTIYYVDAKGKVDSKLLKSVAGYKKDAEDLVERIGQALGEELVYSEDTNSGFKKVAGVYNAYEGYAEDAEFLGGQKLLDLVTNAADIVEAEETVKLLEEAAEEFAKVVRVSAVGSADPFYYYDRLVADNANLLLESNLTADTTKGLKARNNVWIADEYEKVEDALEDWVAEFELSEDNKLAIVAWKKGTVGVADYNYYGQASTTGNTSYVSNKLTNDLLVAAYNSFKTDIAEKIIEVNAISSANVSMVQLYQEIEELWGDFFKLQSKPASSATAKHPANLDIYIDGSSNYSFADVDIAANNMKVIIRDSGIFEEFAEERLEVLFGTTTLTSPRNVTLLDIYTFESDKSTLELDRTPAINGIYFYADRVTTSPTYGQKIDNRAQGEIYGFFKNVFPAIDAASKYINTEIETLDDKLVVSNDLAYVTLEGKYVQLASTASAGNTTLTVGDTTFPVAGETTYFPVSMVYLKEYVSGTTNTYFDNYMNSMKYTVSSGVASAGTNPITIEAFKYHYPDFVALLDLDVFEADKAEKAKLLDELFTEGLAIVEALDDIPYVRLKTVATDNTVYLFDDVDGDGIFDFEDVDKDGVYNPTVDNTTASGETAVLVDGTTTKIDYLTNLSQKSAVDALWNRLVAWRKLGGNHELEQFSNYVDTYGTTYANVYYMESFEDNDQIRVEAAGKMIEELHMDIEALLDIATSFINAVTAIENVHKVNAFSASLTSNNGYTGNLHKNPSDFRNRYTWTKIEAITSQGARPYEGKYSGYNSGYGTESWTSTNDDTKTPTNQFTSRLVMKEVALKGVVTRYLAFKGANVEYIGDPSNDYVTATGVTLYYANPVYVEYDAVKDAADKYEAFDLIAVKAYLLYNLADGKTTGTYASAHDLTLVQSINAAKSVAEIEALILSHNEEYPANAIYFDGTSTGSTRTYNLFGESIYDFEKLDEQMAVKFGINN